MELVRAVHHLEAAHADSKLRGSDRGAVQVRIDLAMHDVSVGLAMACKRVDAICCHRYEVHNVRSALVALGASKDIVLAYSNKIAARVRVVRNSDLWDKMSQAQQECEL